MSKMLENKIIKNTLILTAITLISGLLLGIVYEVTKAPIAASQENAKQEAYRQVIAEAESFEALDVDEEKAADAVAKAEINGASVGAVINEAAAAIAGGSEIGYVVTVTDKEGYGGNIRLSVGILTDGTVSGVSILDISETAGLGMNAKEPAFYGQYAGKQVDKFEVTKGGASSDSEINAISGATITSKAVTGGVNAALAYYQNVLGGSVNE